jgi:hypothetical protein
VDLPRAPAGEAQLGDDLGVGTGPDRNRIPQPWVTELATGGRRPAPVDPKPKRIRSPLFDRRRPWEGAHPRSPRRHLNPGERSEREQAERDRGHVETAQIEEGGGRQ